MRRTCLALILLLVGQLSIGAHSLQGTFTHQWAWSYSGKIYGSAGFTEFTNLPDGQVTATSRGVDGSLQAIQHFFPTGTYSATSYDAYYGVIEWTGTWKQKKTRVVVESVTPDGHRSNVLWVLRNGTIRMSGVHFYQRKRIGRGAGVFRPL